MLETLVSLAGSTQDPAVMETVVAAILKPAGQGGRHASWQFAALRGLFEASARSKQPIATTHEKELKTILDEARQMAHNDAAAEADRILAVNLLRFSSGEQAGDRDLLAGLLTPRVPIAVQQAALKALGRSASSQVPELLLRGWKTYSPAIRGATVDILMSRKAWTSSLIAAIETRRLAPGEIGPVHRGALLSNRDPELRTRANAAFATQSRSRQEVIDAYKPALAAKGDAAAGKAVFARACAVCHRLGDVGFEVGPNLGALAEKSPGALLIAVLDPNRAFESRVCGLHRGDRRWPAALRLDCQRDGQRSHAPTAGGQGRRRAAPRYRGDGGLRPVADARGAGEGRDLARPG